MEIDRYLELILGFLIIFLGVLTLTIPMLFSVAGMDILKLMRWSAIGIFFISGGILFILHVRTKQGKFEPALVHAFLGSISIIISLVLAYFTYNLLSYLPMEIILITLVLIFMLFITGVRWSWQFVENCGGFRKFFALYITEAKRMFDEASAGKKIEYIISYLLILLVSAAIFFGLPEWAAENGLEIGLMHIVLTLAALAVFISLELFYTISHSKTHSKKMVLES